MLMRTLFTRQTFNNLQLGFGFLCLMTTFNSSAFIQACMYVIFQCGFLFLNEYYLYFSSALQGFGQAAIWTSQGTYMAMNSTDETAGFLTGIFWIFAQGCSAVGGVFLYFVFNSGDSETKLDVQLIRIVYGSFTGLCCIGVLLMATLQVPKLRGAVVDAATPITNERRASQRRRSSVLAPAMTEEIVSPLHSIRLLKTRPILFFMIISAYTGVELSFWNALWPTCIGFYSRIAKDPHSVVALNAITLGVGQAVGGAVLGVVGARSTMRSRSTLLCVGLVIDGFVFVIAYLTFPASASLHATGDALGMIEPRVWLVLLGGLLLGVADACLNVQIFAFIVVEYSAHSAQVFALFQLAQTFVTGIIFIYAPFVSLPFHLIALIIGSCLGAFGHIMAERSTAQLKIDNVKQAEVQTLD